MDANDAKRASLRRMIPALGAMALGLWLPACSASAADSSAKDNPNQVVARVNGKPITEADLKANGKDTFEQLEREYHQKQHEIMDSQLHQMVQDRLLDLEAASTKKTKDQLLAEIKPAEVTDADVDKFYEENKAQIPRPKEQIAAQIKQYLQQQRQSEAREKFFGTLEAKYKAEYLLEPIRVEVASSGFPAKGGPATAPVTIVEFSDFQCPFCSRLNPTIEQVMTKYGDKVRLVFRQFPLPMHNFAAKAAEAALCANEQGKFWQMHDSMFKDQSALAVDALKTKAAGLGLNAQAFNSCLDSGKESEAVKADTKAGQAAGVNGTPAMFVNGRFVSGVVPASQLSQIIDEELKRKGQG